MSSGSSGHNTCKVTVSNTSGAVECLQDQYMQALRSGVDTENWAERNFSYIFDTDENEEIEVSLYAYTAYAGHVWTGKAYYI